MNDYYNDNSSVIHSDPKNQCILPKKLNVQ